MARREEITPELLRMLEETVERAAELEAAGGWMGHLYAMYLLAQFREVRAYPLVVQFGRLPGELLKPLCGHFITEDFSNLLASVCGGQVAGIESLIEDESVDVWVRSVALDSLVALVVAGQRSRGRGYRLLPAPVPGRPGAQAVARVGVRGLR